MVAGSHADPGVAKVARRKDERIVRRAGIAFQQALGDVEDLGRLTLYLCTRDCYATNATFHVDGGIDSNNSLLPIPDY